MIIVRESGKYYYVSGDDCYLFYGLFSYKINHDKCYFRKKYLKYILGILDKKEINHKLIISNKLNIYIYISNHYFYYLEKGKEKYFFDIYIEQVKLRLLKYVDRRDFNEIYKKVKELSYE